MITKQIHLTAESSLAYGCPACHGDNFAVPSMAMLAGLRASGHAQCEHCHVKLQLTLNYDGETMSAELYATYQARSNKERYDD